MNFTIEHFHARIKAEIESWPEALLADFARGDGPKKNEGGPEWIR
jgi:hypothetical protein